MQYSIVNYRHHATRGLPRWLSSKVSAFCAKAPGDAGSTPGSGRSPGGGHSNPLQYSCLENPADSPQGCKDLDMAEATEHALTMLYIRCPSLTHPERLKL